MGPLVPEKTAVPASEDCGHFCFGCAVQEACTKGTGAAGIKAQPSSHVLEYARDTRFSLLFWEAYRRRKPQQQSEPISALSNSTAPTRFTCACALAHTHAHARMCMCKHPFHQVIGASYAELAGRNTGFAIGPTGKQFDEINEHFVLSGDARC